MTCEKQLSFYYYYIILIVVFLLFVLCRFVWRLRVWHTEETEPPDTRDSGLLRRTCCLIRNDERAERR